MIRTDKIRRLKFDRLIIEKMTRILGKIPRRGGSPPSDRRLKKINILNNLFDGTKFKELKFTEDKK